MRFGTKKLERLQAGPTFALSDDRARISPEAETEAGPEVAEAPVKKKRQRHMHMDWKPKPRLRLPKEPKVRKSVKKRAEARTRASIGPEANMALVPIGADSAVTQAGPDVELVNSPVPVKILRKGKLRDRKRGFGQAASRALKAKGPKSVKEIAEELGVQPNTVSKALAPLLPSVDSVFYAAHRAEILTKLECMILSSITMEDIRKAGLGSRVLAYCQLFDKRRLEIGQSTSNVLNFNVVSFVPGTAARRARQGATDSQSDSPSE